jgi:hypothetical protein
LIDSLIIHHESILTLIYGVPIGILSGIYSGVIVSRYARFAELRNEVLRVVRSICYISEESKIIISNDSNFSMLVLISSDLFFLKHKKSAERVNLISSQIREAGYKASNGQLTYDEYNKLILDCQFLARNLPANKAILWSLWGKL